MGSNHKPPAILASLVLVAILTAMFFPALFDGKITAPLDITTRMLVPWKENADGLKPHNHNPTDAVTQYLPYHLLAGKSLHEDGYIGWNPYEMGGYSLAGNTMALPGSWTLQLYRFLPFKDAWNLGLIAEFLIAGSGMLVFLRCRKLPWPACLIGAVCYMANSQFVIWIYHRWALGSFCWMPWVLWSIVGDFHWKTPTTRQLMLPCFLALALLGGSLQHMAFVVIACGCLFAGAISNRLSIRQLWPPAAGWSLAFALAIAMAAFSILPQVSAYLCNIGIGHTRGGIGYANGLTQPVFQSLLIPAQIWPWLMGDPQTIDGFRLIKCSFMDVAFLGSIPMVLSIAGVFHKGMPRQAKWLILAGLLIPLTPLVGPLYHRIQLLFLLGGSWMTAEMLARFPIETPRRLIRWMSVAVCALGLALFLGACLPANIRTSIENQVVAQSLVAGSTTQFGDDKAWIEQRARRWTDRFSLAHPRTAWVYGLLAVGTAGLILSSRRNPMFVRAGNVAILTATSLELLTLFQTWTTFTNPDDLLPGNPSIEMVRRAAGPHRVLQRAPDVPFADIFATPNLLSSYAIPSVDAYESIQYRSSLLALTQESPEVRLTLAGVGVSIQPSHTPVADGTADWPISHEAGGYQIRTNPDCPAPIVAGIGPVPGKPMDILASLKTATPVTPAVQTMNRWVFDAPKDSTWVRIAQNWHTGWRWRIPGHDWQPFRNGSDATCWIDTLPTGARQIEARFFPRSAWLSFASLGAALAWLCLIPFLIKMSCPVKI